MKKKPREKLHRSCHRFMCGALEHIHTIHGAHASYTMHKCKRMRVLMYVCVVVFTTRTPPTSMAIVAAFSQAPTLHTCYGLARPAGGAGRQGGGRGFCPRVHRGPVPGGRRAEERCVLRCPPPPMALAPSPFMPATHLGGAVTSGSEAGGS